MSAPREDCAGPADADGGGPGDNPSSRGQRSARPDPVERSRLLELAYAELRGQAAGLLARERGDHTLQPTALVHEAWLRVADQTRVAFQGRRHFLAVASQAMRRVLVDHARAKGTAKRGGDWSRVSLGGTPAAPDEEQLDLLDLEQALVELEAVDERRARVVEMIWFGGCTAEEVGEALGVSARTVGTDWRFARAWLFDRLSRDGEVEA
ncbi:sigma-70 family RNA polymerase sigma factor [Engelhardtia mirabilis]|uniref:ECF sigma factor n=1 Tax=Engelhardtia mirabilis TaxID=2528011 RepID=A0A518BFV8_9BACT|nr:ECF sigma factor [Planctomycetes bacterium Pla133]QDV00195.1 ECF sigma factor [Planctomycetes bacterium Pla86]